MYDVVLRFVNDNLLPLDGVKVLRPFYPGGDYENSEYPEGSVVIDNPPFSILAKIVRNYMKRGIRFFLFGPQLTLFVAADVPGITYIPASADITYENGARVKTGFITNLKPGTKILLPGRGFPENMEKACKVEKKKITTYNYPINVLTAAMFGTLSRQKLEIPESECAFVRKLDGHEMFGNAILLSDGAAQAVQAAKAAQAAKAIPVHLLEKEKEIIDMLNENHRRRIGAGLDATE